MTKEDFLEQLSKQLNHLPQNDYDDIIEHFEEYFDEASSENEDVIIEELGEPQKLAKELLTAMNLPPAEDKDNEADWTNWNLPSTLVKKEFDDVSILDFSLLNRPIEIKTGNVSRITLTYYQESDDFSPIGYQVVDSTLQISENQQVKNEKSLFKLFSLHFLESLKETITVILPQTQQIINIKGRQNNGNIKLIDLKVNHVNLSSLNGIIKLNKIETDLADLDNKNGAIRLNNCQISQGAIKVKNGIISQTDSQLTNCIIKNKNGNIRFTGGEVNKSNIENKNGIIKIQDSRLQDQIKIENKNGTIKVNLHQDFLPHTRVQVRNKNGFVHVNENTNTAFPIKAYLLVENKNGTITVD